ncbi:MAG TPA: ABC transporter substrate-binding protein [Chloroflexota bacterium]|jgi:NitT/TauT family transport system substrate-binding protein|nr:ABC transporter substrate-binding protein [Chloroflexota bacterium]
MRYALFAGWLAAFVLGCSGSPAATAPAPPTAPARASDSAAPLPEKITVSYSTLSGSQVAVYLAAEQGLFAKYGLTAEVMYIASGTTALQSLLAGDVQFSTGAGYEPAAAYVAGAPVRILLGLINTFPNLFLVDPEITAPEQLRGKPIGVSRLGGQPHVAARLALRHWGLDPDTDVQYLQLGGVPEILAGMQSGAVVGGVFTPPTNLRAQQAGYRVLADLGQLGIPYQSTVIVGLQPYVETHPEVTRRFLQAILEGIKLYLTDDAAARAALAKYTRTDDPALLDETIAYYRRIVERRPYPTLAGLQTVLDEVASHDPRARAVRPEDLVNTEPLAELERSGFLAALYGEAR